MASQHNILRHGELSDVERILENIDSRDFVPADAIAVLLNLVERVSILERLKRHDLEIPQ